MTVTVGRLWHHPVKSMQGELVDEVVLGPGGLVGDRAYGFLDNETRRLVSAKHPKRYGAMLTCRASFTRSPRVDEPTPPVRVSFPDGTTIDGSVEDGAELTREVSKLLGREVQLVTSVAPGVAYEEVWPELAGFGPEEFYGALQVTAARDDEAGERILAVPTGLAAPGTLLDFAALHVLAASTLTALAGHHPTGQWNDRRFRPNILLDDESDCPGHGSEPAPDRYVEDDWIGCDLRIGEQARVHVVAPTLRCPMPTLAQGELPFDGDILRTLVRASRRQLGELGKFPCAGAYAEVVTPGVIRVGDRVQITPTAATESALAAAVEMISAGMRASP